MIQNLVLICSIIIGAIVPAARPATLQGQASYYDWHAGQAAAGPGLRAYIGHDWRGSTVRVSGPAGKMDVQLTDYCGCPSKGRVIDLDDQAFIRICGPLSKGVCNVTIRLTGQIGTPATSKPKPIPTGPATDVGP